VFVEQTNCDVEFLFEDEEEIGGHISILVVRSPVFSAMFYHNLQKSMTGKVFVQDIRPQIFKEMLHYIYSGRTMAPLTDAIAQPLFVLSVKYDIEDLQEKCARYLLKSIRTSNAIDLLVWANLHLVEKTPKLTFLLKLYAFQRFQRHHQYPQFHMCSRSLQQQHVQHDTGHLSKVLALL
jgi:speckle-type POZ protein